MPDIVITPASNLIDSTGGTFTIRTADAQALSLKTNNSDALYIKSDGNIGIGTTSPAYKLEVSGTGYFLNNLTANGVTIGSSDIRSSSNILTLGGTSEIIRITGGNVGIGTTSPASKLHVSGGDGILTSATDSFISIKSTSATGNSYLQFLNSSDAAVGAIYYGFTNNDLTFKVNSSTRMYINSSGNVGIGTTSPTALLQVGTSAMGTAASGTTISTSGNLEFNLDGVSGTQRHARIRPTGTVNSGPYAGGISFDTYYYNGSSYVWLNALDILDNGNVGIGTSSPYSILHLNVASASQRYFTISTTDGAGSYNAYGINLRVSDQGHNIAQIKGVYESSGGGGYGGLMFASLAGGTLIDRMRIQADGNIGIGITSASYKLDVYDTNVNVARFYNNQSSLNFILGSTNNSFYTNLIWYTSTGNAQFFKNRSSTSWGGADSFNFYTDSGGFAWHPAGNANLMYLTTAGNLGIGTSSPAAKLEIFANVAAASTPSATLTLNNILDSGHRILFKSGTGDLVAIDGDITSSGSGTNDGVFKISTSVDGSLSERMRITSGGNVGIGTTSPAYKLDVSPVTSTVRLGRVLTGEWPTSANYALFGHAVLDHTNSGNYALLQGSAGDTFLNAASGQPIYFRIANADKMILASGGNVGIGTTNPTQKLEVRGYVLSDLGAGVEAGFYLGNSGHGTRRPAGTNDVYLYTSAGTVYLGANGNSSQHVTVTNSGNVGIGTTSPAATLHVTGAVRFASLPAATGANVVYIASNGDLTSGAAPAGGGSSVTLSGPNNGIVTRDGAAGTTLIAETNYEFNASTRLMYLSGQIGINFTGNTGSATPLEIHGTGGELFSIDDDLSSSLMSVNTIAGLPVFEAFADSTVQMGQYGSGDFIITGNKVGIGYTTPSTVNYKLDVTGTVRLTGLTTNTTSYTSLVVGTSGEICSKVGGAGSTNIFVGAGEMIPRSTGGAGVNSLQTGTNNINYDVLEFDASTAEYAQFIRTLPNNWNLGTITAKFYWTIATTSAGNVVWGIRARSYPDNSALDQAFGTAVTVTDGALTAAYTHISSATSAMTIGGTNALGNPTIFEIYRDAANGSDTLAIDAQLLGLEITYN